MKRHLFAASIAGTLLALLAVPRSAVAGETPLTFDTVGLSCAGGVCGLEPGNVGTRYGSDIAINGGSAGPNGALPEFTVVSGALPNGLVMPRRYGSNGTVIGGTPSRAGAFTFTIQAEDGAGDTARQAYSVRIGPPARLQFTFPQACCPAATVKKPYSQSFFFSGGVGPYVASISSGQLPLGLRLSASPPVSISGSAIAAGTFRFTVEVEDSRGVRATKPGTITVK